MQAVRLCTIAATCARTINSTTRISQAVLPSVACNKWTQLKSRPAQRHYCTADVIPPARAEGVDKEYAPKIKSLVDEISNLTLMEVADLNELLKNTLNIADAPMMAMGAMPAQAALAQEEDEEAETKTQQTAFTVRLMGFDEGKKVALIKEMKNQVAGLNLVQAKKFVESTPGTVKADITKEEAESLQKALEAAGGKVAVE